METDFIYWRHPTPPGIKVEEISGGEDKSGDLWRRMALQVYCENGKEGYREINHFTSGAPYIEGATERISISHTNGLLVVATLPSTPEAHLAEFNERTAMGIDAERADRRQVIGLRERFLSAAELEMAEADSIEANITAWTCKEALYKAALTPGLDFRADIRIHVLPRPADPSTWAERMKDHRSTVSDGYGEASVRFPDGTTVSMRLYSYRSEDCIVTLAYSPKAATFRKS